MFFSRDKLFLASLVVAFALTPAWAQIPAGNPLGFPRAAQANDAQLGGARIGTVIGSVRTLDNKPVPNARIEVCSLRQGTIVATQYTLQDGSFMLNNLPAGEYEVRAESGVLEATQRVEVDQGQTWMTVRMPLPATASTPGLNGATVSVRQLQVPQKAASFLDKAQHAMDRNKLDEAKKYIAKALEAYPEYAQAMAMRGILKLQSQKFQEAVDDANHAIHTDPDNGMAYLVMGAALNEQQKYQAALVPLRQGEALLPNAWQGYFESSKALLHLQKFQTALQQVNKAFTLIDPKEHPDLHLVKGYAYLGLHIYGAALTELEQYVNQVPAGPNTAEVRAMVAKIRPLAGRSATP